MTLLSVLSAILIGAGFFVGAFVGCRVMLTIIKEHRWGTFIVTCLILAGIGVVAFITGGDMSEPVRAVLFRAVLAVFLGFAGGLVYAIRENIYR